MQATDLDFLSGKQVCVVGPNGMVGSAILRILDGGPATLLRLGREQADLRNQQAVNTWFAQNRPTHIFLAAAKVGGIVANDSYPADFLYDNLMIEANVIHAAYEYGAEKLLFLGSSCIYPKMAPQPLMEDALLTGPLEPTNQWYAVAKIAGIKMAEAFRIQHGCNFISAMPTNLYGPGDNFDLNSSHVVPALVRKIVDAKNNNLSAVEIWGTGNPMREFLHVDDCARACVFLMEKYDGLQHVNVGSGYEIRIADLARLIAKKCGFTGKFVFNTEKPDGTPRKLMNSSCLNSLGWRPEISLDQGIMQVIDIISSSSSSLRAIDLAASN